MGTNHGKTDLQRAKKHDHQPDDRMAKLARVVLHAAIGIDSKMDDHKPDDRDQITERLNRLFRR